MEKANARKIDKIIRVLNPGSKINQSNRVSSHISSSASFSVSSKISQNYPSSDKKKRGSKEICKSLETLIDPLAGFNKPGELFDQIEDSRQIIKLHDISKRAAHYTTLESALMFLEFAIKNSGELMLHTSTTHSYLSVTCPLFQPMRNTQGGIITQSDQKCDKCNKMINLMKIFTQLRNVCRSTKNKDQITRLDSINEFYQDILKIKLFKSKMREMDLVNCLECEIVIDDNILNNTINLDHLATKLEQIPDTLKKINPKDLRKCNKCERIFCLKCEYFINLNPLVEDTNLVVSGHSHNDLSCSDHKMFIGVYSSDARSAMLIQKMTKCSNIYCRIPIEKSEGCNHMQCIHCKTHFCYSCGESVDPNDLEAHYKIGSCVMIEY
jgi:hypothetical protein